MGIMMTHMVRRRRSTERLIRRSLEQSAARRTRAGETRSGRSGCGVSGRGATIMRILRIGSEIRSGRLRLSSGSLSGSSDARSAVSYGSSSGSSDGGRSSSHEIRRHGLVELLLELLDEAARRCAQRRRRWRSTSRCSVCGRRCVRVSSCRRGGGGCGRCCVFGHLIEGFELEHLL